MALLLSSCGTDGRPARGTILRPADGGTGGSAGSPDRAYITWDLTDENYPDLDDQPGEGGLSPGSFPVAGIVSHHLLAGELIDNWFASLAASRDIKRFFILSPRHYDLGTGDYSLTDRPWDTAGGRVEADKKIVDKLSRSLGAEIDPEAFVIEHGVNTFPPYIAKYFPGATIIAINYRGEPPVNVPVAEKLWQNLAPYFGGEKGTENFLLISTDFAHHGNQEGTDFKDLRTRTFLDNPGSDSWIFAGCDNRPGMYVLGKMADGMHVPEFDILYHSNSFLLSGHGEDDITSYFFAYLSNREAGISGR